MLDKNQMQEAIRNLLNESDLSRRRMAFFRLCHQLGESSPEVVALIKPLLSDWDFEIRKEAAYWLQVFEIPLDPAEEYALHFALLQFDWLKCQATRNKAAREWLFRGLADRSTRVREKVLRVLNLSDCQTDYERMLYYYGRGDYLELLKFAQEHGLDGEVRKLLREGLSPQKNIPYHQRQCAFALQQLGEKVALPARASRSKIEIEEKRSLPGVPEKTEKTPLEAFLAQLERQGIRTPEGQIYPQIRIGTVTGRITYRNPWMQTWSEEKRRKTILPAEGYVLYRFDFCQIEPRLLIHFLVESFWISLSDVPEGDIYAITGISDRQEAKIWLNRLINGGSVFLPENAPSTLIRFREAVENYRLELIELARQQGYVETLGGRHIEVDLQDSRLPRRIMSFKIQGSAADFFNEAVMALHAHLQLENLPARILFLLFDEVWIEIRADSVDSCVEEIVHFLNSVAKRFQLFVEVPIRTEAVERSRRTS
jgi:DNA polymerase I-like protein with 3'-5' exonuclease and polymerase domains